MTFYSTIILDPGSESASGTLHFSIEATDMLTATRILGAYLKGRFEGSGKGGEISHIGRSKLRGVEYRGL